MSKNTLEELRETRGSIYGEFSEQVNGVAGIVAAMRKTYLKNNGHEPGGKLLAEWHYLAIKLARIAVAPSYRDSYDDISVYSQLIADNHKEQLDLYTVLQYNIIYKGKE